MTLYLILAVSSVVAISRAVDVTTTTNEPVVMSSTEESIPMTPTSDSPTTSESTTPTSTPTSSTTPKPTTTPKPEQQQQDSAAIFSIRTIDFSKKKETVTPEPVNACFSDDMCQLMPGICHRGTCITKTCSSDIICSCDQGFTGQFCDRNITEVEKVDVRIVNGKFVSTPPTTSKPSSIDKSTGGAETSNNVEAANVTDNTANVNTRDALNVTESDASNQTDTLGFGGVDTLTNVTTIENLQNVSVENKTETANPDKQSTSGKATISTSATVKSTSDTVNSVVDKTGKSPSENVKESGGNVKTEKEKKTNHSTKTEEGTPANKNTNENANGQGGVDNAKESANKNVKQNANSKKQQTATTKNNNKAKATSNHRSKLKLLNKKNADFHARLSRGPMPLDKKNQNGKSKPNKANGKKTNASPNNTNGKKANGQSNTNGQSQKNKSKTKTHTSGNTVPMKTDSIPPSNDQIIDIEVTLPPNIKIKPFNHMNNVASSSNTESGNSNEGTTKDSINKAKDVLLSQSQGSVNVDKDKVTGHALFDNKEVMITIEKTVESKSGDKTSADPVVKKQSGTNKEKSSRQEFSVNKNSIQQIFDGVNSESSASNMNGPVNSDSVNRKQETSSNSSTTLISAISSEPNQSKVPNVKATNTTDINPLQQLLNIIGSREFVDHVSAVKIEIITKTNSTAEKNSGGNQNPDSGNAGVDASAKVSVQVSDLTMSDKEHAVVP